MSNTSRPFRDPRHIQFEWRAATKINCKTLRLQLLRPVLSTVPTNDCPGSQADCSQLDAISQPVSTKTKSNHLSPIVFGRVAGADKMHACRSHHRTPQGTLPAPHCKDFSKRLRLAEFTALFLKFTQAGRNFETPSVIS